MYKVGLSSTDKDFTEELFQSYERAGISEMELNIYAPMWEELDFRQVKDWADKYGVHLWSAHLPFGYGAQPPLDLSNPEWSKETVRRTKEYIKKGAEIGIEKFVTHASLEPIEDSDRPMRMATAKESLLALAETTVECGVTLAVEALPRTCLGRTSDEMLELIGVHPALRTCLDTNHIQLQDNADFIRKVADKLVTLHVSDFDFVRERHWLPGEGKVDWKSLLDALADVGYSGVWMYEVAFKAPWTIIRERDLTPEDFILNAQELFAGKKPTLISRINPEIYEG